MIQWGTIAKMKSMMSLPKGDNNEEESLIQEADSNAITQMILTLTTTAMKTQPKQKKNTTLKTMLQNNKKTQEIIISKINTQVNRIILKNLQIVQKINQKQ